ncbi:hypothetical protein C8R44DRAFT_730276 [Mycena epipterygia]|nr:hypothetical protein C8R44DRAFT_730276 [Mycena epipterygia]
MDQIKFTFSGILHKSEGFAEGLVFAPVAGNKLQHRSPGLQYETLRHPLHLRRDPTPLEAWGSNASDLWQERQKVQWKFALVGLAPGVNFDEKWFDVLLEWAATSSTSGSKRSHFRHTKVVFRQKRYANEPAPPEDTEFLEKWEGIRFTSGL